MTNFAKRTIIGILGIPLLVFCIYAGGIYFLLFSLLINCFGLWELYRLFERKKFFPLKGLSIISSCVIILAYYADAPYLIYLVILVIMMIVSAELFRQVRHNPLNTFIALFGFYYITLSLIFLNELLKVPNFNPVLYIIILIWTCDITAYLGGSLLGKRQMTVISPKKTWEGAMIGFAMTLAASFIFRYFNSDAISVTDAIAIGVIVGIFGQLGDLFESFLKRYAGVKDSSSLIPGHGGVLDRFDSLIFAAPVTYIYIYYLRQFVN